MLVTRRLTMDDVPALTELVVRNREFLAPWEPLRADDFFTLDTQAAQIREALAEASAGRVHLRVIVDEAGDVVGRMTLSGIVRGALQSCAMGYWVSAHANGRGLATAAVRETVRVAFDDLRLHRVQAETLTDNVGSQRVLERNGFTRYGLAPEYLRIAGRWQDFVMYQVINRAFDHDAPEDESRVGDDERGDGEPTSAKVDAGRQELPAPPARAGGAGSFAD
ncbi:GNAT family N-acetyltransferase [Embleya sp. NPDC059237]|uniref:GNAT family N-acetyltransferase n=1 Tax=Embleya sp. NPDC059237 TaxID=3346784 RepID=UPI00369981C6